MGVMKYRGKWCYTLRAKDPTTGKTKQIRKVAIRQTKRGAQLEEARARMEIAEGTYWTNQEKPKVTTYDEYLEEFVRLYCEVKLASSTAKDYTSALRNHVSPVVGHMDLADIGARQVDEVRERLGDKSVKTVRNVLGYFRRSMAVAKQWGYIDHVPHFEFPKAEKSAPKYLTQEEARRLLDAGAEYAPPHINWLLLLGLHSGLRFSEMVAVRWEDVDGEAITVRRAFVEGEIKRTKSGHDRVIPMTATLKEAFAKLERGAGYVVQNEDGTPYTYSQLQYWLIQVHARAELPDEKRGWHILRHTYASHLAMQGVPILTISKLLGHSDVRVTMRYAHLSPSAVADQVGKLDGLF